MAEARERLVQWLRDAHAMEQQAETMMKGHVKRVEHYPEFEKRMNAHLEETRRQADRLESCLDQLGEKASGMKDMGAKTMAAGLAMSGMFPTTRS